MNGTVAKVVLALDDVIRTEQGIWEINNLPFWDTS